MSSRQFARHKCEPKYKATKTISVLEMIDLTCEDDKKQILAVGLDGVDYLISVEKPLAIPFIQEISRRKVTDSKSDGEVTEPYSLGI
jgi:hypothetical protein